MKLLLRRTLVLLVENSAERPNYFTVDCSIKFLNVQVSDTTDDEQRFKADQQKNNIKILELAYNFFRNFLKNIA
jgi:hypothetical protein